MISKRNKVRISGSFRHVLVLPITLATLLSSCVEGDLYDLYDEINIESQINRTKITKETNNTHIVNSAGHYFEISENVFTSNRCMLEALFELLPFNKKQIKRVMKSVDNDIDHFPTNKVRDVICLLNEEFTNYSISYEDVNVSNITVGDIAITNSSLTLTGYCCGMSVTKTSETGHCFVVDEIISFHNGNEQYVLLFDNDEYLYCKMAASYFQGGIRIGYSSN